MAIRKICPECGQQYGARPAVSRKDRKTEICPDCGTRNICEVWHGHREKSTIRSTDKRGN